MSLDRTEVESILSKIAHTQNTDYNVGALAALMAATEDAELQEELLTTLVYQQTIKYETQTAGVSGITQGVAQALGISNEQLEKAGERVYSSIREQAQNAEAANETQSNDSH